MHRIRYFNITISLFQIFLLLSCFLPVRTAVQGSYYGSGVPSEFKPDQHILLVAAKYNSKNFDKKKNDIYTRELDHMLKKHYSYRFEIVPFEAVYNLSGKYGDTSIYRYAILIETYLTEVWKSKAFPNINFMAFPEQKTEFFDFAFYDRNSLQRFPSISHNAVLEAGVKNIIAQVDKKKK